MRQDALPAQAAQAQAEAQDQSRAAGRGLLQMEHSSRKPSVESGAGIGLRPRISVVIPQHGEGWAPAHGRSPCDVPTPTGTPLSCPEPSTHPGGASPLGSQGSPLLATPLSCPEVPGHLFSSGAPMFPPQGGSLAAVSPLPLGAPGMGPPYSHSQHLFEFSPHARHVPLGPRESGGGEGEGEDLHASTPVLATPGGWVSPSAAFAGVPVAGAVEPKPWKHAPATMRRGRHSGRGRRVHRAAPPHNLNPRPSTPAPHLYGGKPGRSPGAHPPKPVFAAQAVGGQGNGGPRPQPGVQPGVPPVDQGREYRDLYPEPSGGSRRSFGPGTKSVGSQSWRGTGTLVGDEHHWVHPQNTGGFQGSPDNPVLDLPGPTTSNQATKPPNLGCEQNPPLPPHSQHRQLSQHSQHSQQGQQGQASAPSRAGQEKSPPFHVRGGHHRRRGGSDGGELLRYAVASAHNSPPSLSSSPPLQGSQWLSPAVPKHWREGGPEQAKSEGGSGDILSLHPGPTPSFSSSRSSSGGSASLPVKGPLTSGDIVAGEGGHGTGHVAAPNSSLSTEVSLTYLASEGVHPLVHPGSALAKASWRHLVRVDPSSGSASPSSPSSPAARTLPKASRHRLWEGDRDSMQVGGPRNNHALDASAANPSAGPSAFSPSTALDSCGFADEPIVYGPSTGPGAGTAARPQRSGVAMEAAPGPAVTRTTDHQASGIAGRFAGHQSSGIAGRSAESSGGLGQQPSGKAGRSAESRGLGPRPHSTRGQRMAPPPRSERAFAAMAALAARRAREACKSSSSEEFLIQRGGEEVSRSKRGDRSRTEEEEGRSRRQDSRSKDEDSQLVPVCESGSRGPGRPQVALGAVSLVSSGCDTGAHMARRGATPLIEGDESSGSGRGRGRFPMRCAPQLQGSGHHEGRLEGPQPQGGPDTGVEIFVLESPSSIDSPTIMSPRTLVRLDCLREKDPGGSRGMQAQWGDTELKSSQSDRQSCDAQGALFLVDATKERPRHQEGDGASGRDPHGRERHRWHPWQQEERGGFPQRDPNGKGADGMRSWQQEEREGLWNCETMGKGGARMCPRSPRATSRSHAVVRPDARSEGGARRHPQGAQDQQQGSELEHRGLEKPRPGGGARHVRGSSMDMGLWGLEDASAQGERRGSMGPQRLPPPHGGPPSSLQAQEGRRSSMSHHDMRPTPASCAHPTLQVHIPGNVSPMPPRPALARSPLGLQNRPQASEGRAPQDSREGNEEEEKEEGGDEVPSVAQAQAQVQAQARAQAQSQVQGEEGPLWGGRPWQAVQSEGMTDSTRETARDGARAWDGETWAQGQWGESALQKAGEDTPVEVLASKALVYEALASPRKKGGRRGPRDLLRSSLGQRGARHGSLGKHQTGIRPPGATTLVLPQDSEWHHGSMEGSSPVAHSPGSGGRSPAGASVESPLAAAVAAFAQVASPRGWIPVAAGFEYETALALGCRAGVPLHDHVLRKPYDSLKRRYAIESWKVSWGQFGTIRQCRELASGTLFACKTIHKSHVKVRHFTTEYAS